MKMILMTNRTLKRDWPASGRGREGAESLYKSDSGISGMSAIR